MARPHPPPSLPDLQSSLLSITTTAYILNGFAHRNKNQHRATKWWPAFAMLRRHLHKILPDLEAAVQRAEILLSTSTSAFPPSSKKRRKGLPSAAAGDASNKEVKQPELDRVMERLSWMDNVLNIKCYEAFTQLTADRQFAQLGLVLLGVLAQVQAAIVPLIPPAAVGEEVQGQEQNATPAIASITTTTTTKSNVERGIKAGPRNQGENSSDLLGEAVSRDALSASQHSALNHDDDFGIAISRDEINNKLPRDSNSSSRQNQDPEVKKAPPNQHFKSAATKRLAATDDEDASSSLLSRSIKRKKQRMDDTNQQREDRPSPVDEAKAPTPLKKKKKKSKKGGDEFDDLFGGLM